MKPETIINIQELVALVSIGAGVGFIHWPTALIVVGVLVLLPTVPARVVLARRRVG